MFNKKFFLIFGSILILTSIISFGLGQIYESDEGIFIEVYSALPRYIRTSISGYAEIESVEIVGETTQIKIDDAYATDLNLTSLEAYLINLGDHNELMKQFTMLYPDNQPAPLCLRDVGTKNNNGIYSVNNELVIVVSDVRCPN